MIYEIDASCANCPLQEPRNEMVDGCRSLEEIANASPGVQLVEEGSFHCDGPKKWTFGPIVLGYTCQSDPHREPKIEIVDTNQ